MAESLAGTAALVTGASSGIGQAVAEQLAQHGAAVAVVARRADRLEELVQRIEKNGGAAHAIAANLDAREGAFGAVAQAVGKLGRLDTVVNAAGVMLNGDSVKTPAPDWDRMVDINLRGVLHVTKAALPHLLEAVGTSSRKVTDVVNISSVAGRAAAPTVAVYNATKFGVTAATEAWRQEYTSRGIRFSVIEPGAVATELWNHESEEAAAGSAAMFDKVERLHAEDIADVLSYIVTGPRRVAINEVVIRPTDQTV
ncbi:SDR family NAD(P)-dependent oxidoreductase [Amycolatopsis ultiminotia]|uniref:SDR family NAD(P)-dependent oxidoreductase n=1 Tax=Amycolatopsis ultiminotia TaxID=543629 RepID=A0ABP6WAW1_9PSEU